VAEPAPKLLSFILAFCYFLLVFRHPKIEWQKNEKLRSFYKVAFSFSLFVPSSFDLLKANKKNYEKLQINTP
jgi:hypothetical protein